MYRTAKPIDDRNDAPCFVCEAERRFAPRRRFPASDQIGRDKIERGPERLREVAPLPPGCAGAMQRDHPGPRVDMYGR
jgi:hypothetical protein